MTRSELGMGQKTGDAKKPIPSPLLFHYYDKITPVFFLFFFNLYSRG